MSNYSINLNLSESTLRQLRAAGKVLYAFKGINASASPGAKSTIWFKEDSLYENNNLSWEVDYDVYISATKTIDVGTKIISSTSRSMGAGGTANVDDANTIDVDRAVGKAMYYSIVNQGNKQHVCGLSHRNPRGELVPICASILNGGFDVGIEPIEKIYLVFSDALHQEGVVMVQSTGPGYVIDVTDDFMQGASVAFDINLGWSCADVGQRSKCKPVKSGLAFGDILNAV
jgi:hypothetical protein